MRNFFARSLVLAGLLVGSASAAFAGGNKLASVTQVPFSTWLDAQQTNLVAWDARVNSKPNSAFGDFNVTDYAGKLTDANHLSYGFSASGTVKLTELADGSGEIQVDESFSNALMYTNDPNGIRIFGYSTGELPGNPPITPALASGRLQFKYTVPDASNPTYNVGDVVFNGAGTIVQIKFHAVGSGPLRVGFGVPDGTPGQCEITQTGLFNTSGGGATADAYPVEQIKVIQTGGSALGQVVGLSGSRQVAGSAAAAPAHGSWGAIKALYH